MYNELFSIGPITIYGYGFMIAIGCICALLLAYFRAKKKNLNTDFVLELFLTCAIFGFLGAKLLYCLVNFEYFIKDPLTFVMQSGFVVYGGIILGALAGFTLAKIKKQSLGDYFDLAMPSVAIAQGFGRIGCFLAGCCYGKETTAWYGVSFPSDTLAGATGKVIPTQLISSFCDFALAGILLFYSTKTKKKGNVGILYLILYTIGRFFIEFLRNDYRGEIGIFSTSQFISLILFFGLVIFQIVRYILDKKAKTKENK